MDGDIVVTKTSNNFIFYSIYKGVENRKVLTYVDYHFDSNRLMFNDNLSSLCFIDDIVEQRFATEEEKKKLFDAIKENGYKWNTNTKTLEKLVEPSEGTLVQIDLTRELRIADEVEVILGDYEFVLKDGKTYFVKKKPQYPKTYEECCKILGIEDRENGYCGYEYEFLGEFQKLYICRNAYWKIAGEEMGLDKPWKPDWTNFKVNKFCIGVDRNITSNCNKVTGNKILAFPTAEMRDAFYDNFKELIEQCKELL